MGKFLIVVSLFMFGCASQKATKSNADLSEEKAKAGFEEMQKELDKNK